LFPIEFAVAYNIARTSSALENLTVFFAPNWLMQNCERGSNLANERQENWSGFPASYCLPRILFNYRAEMCFFSI
jgi:hypothetical protein